MRHAAKLQLDHERLCAVLRDAVHEETNDEGTSSVLKKTSEKLAQLLGALSDDDDGDGGDYVSAAGGGRTSSSVEDVMQQLSEVSLTLQNAARHGCAVPAFRGGSDYLPAC